MAFSVAGNLSVDDKILIESPTALFDFESNFTHLDYRTWMIQNRYLSIVFGGIYLVLLFFGRRCMHNREPYSVRGPLALWNLFMSVFSITFLYRLGPYFLKRTFSLAFYEQVCETEYETLPVTMFWLDWFVLTKPVEFVDTMFIVLRKQNLNFLHYYHHVTVVILCWYSLGIAPVPPNSMFYVAMNAFVHSIMYTYYLLRSVRFPVPKVVQMAITFLQIVQMAIGIFINVSPLVFRFKGAKCDAAFESICVALGIYFSYLLLFSNFFRQTYFGKKSKTEKERTD